MHVIRVVTYGEPKKGYLNFALGNLWATQPIALLIWPPLHDLDLKTPKDNYNSQIQKQV